MSRGHTSSQNRTQVTSSSRLSMKAVPLVWDSVCVSLFYAIDTGSTGSGPVTRVTNWGLPVYPSALTQTLRLAMPLFVPSTPFSRRGSEGSHGSSRWTCHVGRRNRKNMGLHSSLVRDGQTSPHKPRLVVSHSTCPSLSPSPPAHTFIIGPR